MLCLLFGDLRSKSHGRHHAVLVRHELGVIEYIDIHTSDRDGGTGQGTDQDDVGRIAKAGRHRARSSGSMSCSGVQM